MATRTELTWKCAEWYMTHLWNGIEPLRRAITGELAEKSVQPGGPMEAMLRYHEYFEASEAYSVAREVQKEAWKHGSEVVVYEANDSVEEARGRLEEARRNCRVL